MLPLMGEMFRPLTSQGCLPRWRSPGRERVPRRWDGGAERVSPPGPPRWSRRQGGVLSADVPGRGGPLKGRISRRAFRGETQRNEVALGGGQRVGRALQRCSPRVQSLGGGAKGPPTYLFPLDGRISHSLSMTYRRTSPSPGGWRGRPGEEGRGDEGQPAE